MFINIPFCFILISTIILCPVANQALDPSTEEELFGMGQWRGYSPVSLYLPTVLVPLQAAATIVVSPFFNEILA